MFVTDDEEYIQYIYMLKMVTNSCIVVRNDANVDEHLHKANILHWN